MIRSLRRISGALAAAALLLSPPLAAQRQPAAEAAVPPLPVDVRLVSDSTGNLLVHLGSDGAFLVGHQTPSLVARTRQVLASLPPTRVRYVLATTGDSAVRAGDAGWTRDGAVVVAHEGIRNRIRREARNDSTALRRLPMLGFSNVFQIRINDDEIHAVHHPAGYSDGDVIVHFEDRQFLYLGSLFTSDGYPALDLEHGGSVEGLIRTAKEFVDTYREYKDLVEPIVPGRGPLASWQDLADYLTMLVAVRDRVKPMVAAGRKLEEVVASRPTAEFDARWGRGPVAPARFVEMVYRSLSNGTATPATGSHH
ncbi:MAG TPA: hypothetical protein VF746_11150 [Longimicrobium sp.]|jgi:hypothetical protein